jgi:hypothetical protein
MKEILRNTSVALIVAATLSGCATDALPEYPIGHPANPDSAAGVWDSGSVLDSYRPASARRGSPAPTSNGGHAHGTDATPASEPAKEADHEHH